MNVYQLCCARSFSQAAIRGKEAAKLKVDDPREAYVYDSNDEEEETEAEKKAKVDLKALMSRPKPHDLTLNSRFSRFGLCFLGTKDSGST